MAAPKGNRYAGDALAFCKTPELRAQAFEAYCHHVAQGYLKESFCWESEDKQGRATYRSVKNIIEKHSEDLSLLLLDFAESKNLFFWEKLGMDIATGGNPKGEGWVWANNMFNRFKSQLGWRLSDKSEEKHDPEAKVKEGKMEELANETSSNGSSKE